MGKKLVYFSFQFLFPLRQEKFISAQKKRPPEGDLFCLSRKCRIYIPMPPIPPGISGAMAGSFGSGFSAIIASVVIIRPATDAAS